MARQEVWYPLTSRAKHLLFLGVSFILPIAVGPRSGWTEVVASFDCQKASSTIEKLICTDEDLAELDTWLAEAYSNARSETSKAAKIQNEQRVWLREVRNKCADTVCLQAAYAKRLDELEPPITFDEPEVASPGNPAKAALGRCHMGTCWWWGIDELRSVQTAPEGKLVNVKYRASSESYSRLYLKTHDYPNTPPQGALWGGKGSLYLFCSKQVPLVLSSESAEGGGLEVIYPFNTDGSVSSATEGMVNLYSASCPEYPISEGASLRRLSVERITSPTDIFGHLR